MVALVLVGVGLGAVHASFHGSAAERVRKALAVGLVTVGAFGATNYLLAPKGDIKLAWLSDEPSAVAAARTAGRPLLVDFAASWCLPCREFEVKVFSRPEVATAMQRFTLLRVDVTHEDDDPSLGAIKQKYDAVTLPAIRVVSPVGEIVGKTDTLVPPEEFLGLLSRAAP
jgi:thiol:disulfide interchange protein